MELILLVFAYFYIKDFLETSRNTRRDTMVQRHVRRMK